MSNSEIEQLGDGIISGGVSFRRKCDAESLIELAMPRLLHLVELWDGTFGVIW